MAPPDFLRLLEAARDCLAAHWPGHSIYDYEWPLTAKNRNLDPEDLKQMVIFLYEAERAARGTPNGTRSDPE